MDVETGKTKNGCRDSRGFAWILCGISFVAQFLVLGFYKGFGPIYVSLLREFKAGDSLTSWVASISFAIAFMLTPVTFELGRRYGFRITMCVGSILYGLGLLTSSFAGSVPVLYVTFGIIFGIGQSLCYSASIMILPVYFKKNWALAHGIALSGNGLGALVIAPVFEYILSTFGFQKGFQLIATASIVLFFGGLFYVSPAQPKNDDESKRNDEGDKEIISEEERIQQDEGIEMEEEPQRPLLKNKPFIIFLTGTTLMHFGYYIPYVHLVRMAIDMGISDPRAALLPGYMSLAQSIGKIILGKLATYRRADKVFMYQVALLANCLATTLCPIITNYTGLVIYAVVFGLADGGTSANNMLVVGDLVGRKLLSRGYSMFLLTSATSFLLGPPVAGFLYDETGSYSLAFFMSGATAFLASCVMFLVPIFKRKQDEEDEKLITSPSVKRSPADKALLIEKKIQANDVSRKDSGNVSRKDSGISMQFSKERQGESATNADEIGRPTQFPSTILTVTWSDWSKGTSSRIQRRRHNRLGGNLQMSNSTKLLYHIPFFPVHLGEEEINDLLGRETDV